MRPVFLLERILCPVDFSDLSRKGLVYAASFAARYRARLYVLHVMDFSLLYGYSLESLGESANRVEADMEEVSRGKMQAFVTEGVRGVCEVEREIRKGKPFVEIIRFARERDVDLIVLSTHGHGGLAHGLIGSTAERVVRKAPCPVLTVRAVEHEFVTA